MYEKYIKRFLDFFISLIAIIILSPIFLIVAILFYPNLHLIQKELMFLFWIIFFFISIFFSYFIFFDPFYAIIFLDRSWTYE